MWGEGPLGGLGAACLQHAGKPFAPLLRLDGLEGADDTGAPLDLGGGEHELRRVAAAPSEALGRADGRVGDRVAQQRVQRRDHRLLDTTEPLLDRASRLHLLGERHSLALGRRHRDDVERHVGLHEVEALDVVEALDQVRLHRLRVAAARDLEQLVVGEEAEAREAAGRQGRRGSEGSEMGRRTA